MRVQSRFAADQNGRSGAVADPINGSRLVASTLFRTLIANVNRRRMATDRDYFALVSVFAELLCDDEVAALALYLAPQLAVGACFRAELPAAPMLQRRSLNRHA
ncbi:MAG TPA: hypothetical protein VGR79_05775 [Stellaceae bacterium]|nr:hypothetical protein [Stellaceae bacterium]